MWKIFETISDGIGAEFRGRPNLRQTYASVGADQAQPGLSNETFEPGKSYFTVRLVELRLATAGRYLKDFLPICTCVLRFDQAGEKRTVPFVVGAELIRSLVGNAPADAAKRISFNNLAVANNIPVPGDNVTMYITLCRIADNRIVQGLLELAAETASAVGGPTVAPLVKPVTDFAGGLMKIFSTDGVETRFGRLDGKALSKSGYRILAASTNPALAAEGLTVSDDGQLVRRQGAQETTIDDVDYLVLAFEHRSTLVDPTFSSVENLPFHAHWRAAVDKIVRSKGTEDSADAEMTELRSAVLQSRALTETDRLPLLQLYDVKQRQMEAQFKPQKMAGEDTPLLTALGKRVDDEAREGSHLAPLLHAARAAVSDALNVARQADLDVHPPGAEMAMTFADLMQGQRDAFARASVQDLTAAAYAYAAAAAKG